MNEKQKTAISIFIVSMAVIAGVKKGLNEVKKRRRKEINEVAEETTPIIEE